MLHCIARLIEPLLRLLWPPPPAGHRAPLPAPRRNRPRQSGALPPRPGHAPEPYHVYEATALVRPCLPAHERSRAEERHRRARRRTLWLAVHGIDIGPRLIHGIEVTP
ncbi:hypothetical protein BJP40_00480 [Streptomyces sp. CC53]|uniref:hypothetical protein n=1 Tax=unclassified Streptomyces TaxID=2593676 RepID=UPI0008DDAA40|nr:MULTISPECIES: hypothetical protein [unclassified Streptomyces]OII61304.1 hypothetical protein BJP40_00480 [Streptomyces sp. CC53]